MSEALSDECRKSKLRRKALRFSALLSLIYLEHEKDKIKMRCYSIKKIIFFVSFAAILVITSSSALADLAASKIAYDDGNFVLALQELKPLAASGDPEAQARLGEMYAKGQGTSRDDEEAYVWYVKAAIQGNSEAQIAISDMYANGKGVEKDAVMSAYWQWKAADSFDKAAADLLVAEEDKAEIQVIAIEYDIANKKLIQLNPDKKIHACLPDYPSLNQAKILHGTVIAASLLGVDGKVKETVLLQSSGHEPLDHAVMSGLERCTFNPDTIGGKPRESYFKSKYVWIVH